MHSRIIQLDNNPIKKEEFVDEDYILMNHQYFYEEIADYVAEVDDYDEELEWFKGYINNNQNYESKDENNSIEISEEKIKDYLKMKYDIFKRSINSFEDFLDYSKYYDAICALNPRFGLYIFYNDELLTFDEFYRHLETFKRYGKYYIGGILDYHY